MSNSNPAAGASLVPAQLSEILAILAAAGVKQQAPVAQIKSARSRKKP
jgi:hypothetical protein